MKTLDAAQGSAEWLRERVGRIGGSSINHVMSMLKPEKVNEPSPGEKKDRRRFRLEIITERLTGKAVDHYVSPDMQWGTDYESLARAEYEQATGYIVDQVGLIYHPAFDYAHVSPDGLVTAENGGIEIKAPRSTTHLQWIIDNVVPEEHENQCYWLMACAPDMQWVDFISYDPRTHPKIQLFMKRLSRNDDRIAEITASVQQFECEVQEAIQHLGLPPNYWARDTSTAPIEAKDFFLDDVDLDRIIKL